MTISLIVAMSQNRAIGVKNDLPWHIPADLKRFKSLTIGKPVIMGRKTFESIFNRIKKPLPDRPNIVVSRAGFWHDGVSLYPDLQTAINETQTKYRDQEIMIIGGASIYEQILPFADKIYLTLIEKNYDGDAWFPELVMENWKETKKEAYAADTDADTPPYVFLTLERICC